MSTTLSVVTLPTHQTWSRRNFFLESQLISLFAIVQILCIAHIHLVAPNSINSNGTNGNSANSLPSLSERAAGNQNSRYLSASSTASLAAATAAAAANQQTASSNSQSNGAGGSASQTALLHQAQHQHQHLQQQQHNIQQQQQQQQQQQVTANNNQQQQSLVQPAAILQQQVTANSPAQYSPVAQQPASQTNNPPPVMSSTYAYNPLTGQYQSGSSDLGQLSQTQSPAYNVLSFQQQQQQQQQQPVQYQFQTNPSNQFGTNFGQSSPLASYPYQTFASNPPRQQQRPPPSFPFGFVPGLTNNQQQVLYQQQQPFRYQSAFTRRNGLSSLRPQNNYLGAGPDDDSGAGGFSYQQQQQQQQAGVSLADQLAASLGLNLDPSYSSGLPSPSNVYLQQQQNGNQPVDQSQPSASVNQINHQLATGFGHSQHLIASNGGSVPMGANQFATSGGEHHRSDQQCIAADGRHGTCYQASECIRRGGTPMGRCAGNNLAGLVADVSSANPNLSGGPSSSVCCLFDVTCGQFAAERFVYFRNPGYPTNSYDQSRMCRAKIGKLDKGVCQFRVDMLRFDIAKPTNGNCSQDMFVVSGQNENYVIPKICGFNDGQHYYVGVDESGVITLHMMMMGYYRRSFEILITQIPCRSDFGAPAHCLQYFVGTHGTIKSFNYDDDYATTGPSSLYGSNANSNGNNNQAFVNYDLQQDGSSSSGVGVSSASAPYGLQILQRQQQQQMFTAPQQGSSNNRFALLSEPSTSYQFGGYPNDLDYTICVRKESGFCSVTYQMSRASDQGALAPFAVGQTFYGAGGHNDSASAGWHSVSTDCRDDYLLIGGVRLCSGQPLTTNSYDQYSQQQQLQNNGSFGGYLQQQQMLLQQQQQLQNQQNMLMQQLARLQQQQQAAGNVSANSLGQQQQQQLGPNVGATVNSNGQANNLEQQQAAVVQQLMLVQQHLSSLASTPGQQQQQSFNGYQTEPGQNPSELQGSIITDTTSGPFLLRFVSNNARNARGFHIDYRQNPCK